MSKSSATSTSKLASTARPAAKHPPESNDALRSAFTSSAIGMSWQLAIIVLVAIFGGYKLDQITGRQPLFTLIGLILALAGSILIIRRALKAVNNFDIPTSVSDTDRSDSEARRIAAYDAEDEE